MNKVFSFAHTWAIVIKEFIQMKRDRMTFALMIGIPLLELIMFGYAINANPRHLPMAFVTSQNTQYTRTLEQALINTDYFNIVSTPRSLKKAVNQLAYGDVQFVISVPPHFSRELVRGQRPQVLMIADASDPLSTGNASAAASELIPNAFNEDLRGPLSHLVQSKPPVDFVLHAKYNPDNLTRFNIVPGLIGVVLTMVLVMITSQAITREYERGTIENLLSMPITAMEVMVGTIIPYIVVAYVQIILILVASKILFQIPIEGSIWLLLMGSFPFIIASLSVGVMFSAIAKNQLQATQLSIFFFLPSVLLTGFMFPFYGMPEWAQWIGKVLPITYYMRMVRGVMLKGNGVMFVLHEVWPILIFWLVVTLLGVKFFRRTLD